MAGFALGALAHRAGMVQAWLRPLGWSDAARQDAFAAYYAARRAMHQAFPAKGRYAVLGDSNVEQMNAWREAFPAATIVNLGIAGDTTVGVLHRLGDVLATGAKTVVLLIGSNDLGILHASSTEIAARHESIRRRLIEAGMDVVAISVFTGDPGLHGPVAELNAAIAGTCKAPGCTFVDLTAALCRNGVLKSAYTYDGRHLNAEGYKVWVESIAPLIK